MWINFNKGGTMRINEGKVKISVRDLVELALRKGSINASFISGNRAVLGTLAHKKIQKSMDENYEAEVKLIHECRVDNITFIVEGRADGIIHDLVSVTIDEIKSTMTSLDLIDEDYNPLHWAQAKCYAYFYAHSNHLKSIQVRLTYYHLDTKEIKHLLQTYTFGALETFFNEIILCYAKYIRFYMDWVRIRDGSLKALIFPFENYREGQRTLAVNVYRSIEKGNNLYVSAPTGIGKTISTLFPTLKAMGEGCVAKIFYLTAKTITRTVAEQAVGRLYKQGVKIKAITLTAKDKICFQEKRECNPDYCIYAKGHFDRVDEAIYESINKEDLLTREVIEYYAKKHQVCPFELALDLATWADLIICDYNYIFDPTVALKRFLDNKDFVLLIDEAHNLVDRAREMYSASISKRQVLHLKTSISKHYPTIAKELGKINSHMLNIRKDYIDVVGNYISGEAPKEMYTLVRKFINACDKRLQKGAMSSFPTDLLDLYFQAYQFSKLFEFFDEHYMTYAESEGHEVVLRMFCIDPSFVIANILSTCRSAIFFSATLLPIDYYKYMLGGLEDKAIHFASPFEPEHTLRLLATEVSTRYKDRENSYGKIGEYILNIVQGKVGNYMVFFPSYKYMMAVYELLEKTEIAYKMCVQEGGMDEEAREDFLAQFKPSPIETTIGFCVLGGIFSEGIDLTEDRLIGTIIVGVGLPQICLERDLIKAYFDKVGKDGYHYAYTYPGMNKVLQAVGRLIRTEEDKGVVLLIDDRFNTALYGGLMPQEFDNRKKVRIEDVKVSIKNFWEFDSSLHS